MLKVRLVSTTGASGGARIKVDRDTFLIGRHESCHLWFKSRSVSRRHCVILQDDGRVMIQDLGSRNGTIVNGEVLRDGEACRLWHRSVIKIGKLSFRLSLREAESGEPVVSPASSSGVARLSGIALFEAIDDQPDDEMSEDEAHRKGNGRVLSTIAGLDARDLLDELDAIAGPSKAALQQDGSVDDDSAHFDSDADTGLVGGPGTNDTTTGSHFVESLDDEDSVDDPDAFDTTELSADHPLQLHRQGEDERSHSADENASREPVSDPPKSAGNPKDDPEKKKKPGRIPEHLRSKGAANSHSAAEEALRRMFSNRR